jgi:hypothetical protein
MNSVYTFRLDEKTNLKLHILAGLTHRSRANLLRWLIQNFPINQVGQLPNMEIPSDTSNISEKSSIIGNNQSEVGDE